MVAGVLFLAFLALTAAQNTTCDPNGPRTDCGFYGITQDQCQAKSCCWGPVFEADGSKSGDTPWCFFPNSAPATQYNLINITQTSTGYLGYVGVNDSSSTQIKVVRVDISFESADRFHIKYTDPNNKRWEIPDSLLPTPGVDSNVGTLNYDFSYTSSPASFAITRKSDKTVIFNASGLHFEDTYLSIRTIANSASGPNIYGLGEHVDPFDLQSNTHSYTMWTADVPTPPDQNLYGSHPFYLEVLSSGNAHGVFLRNSNGMDVIVSSNSVQFNVNGGIIDLYVFIGPSPTQAVQQYHKTIGFSYLPAYWSLGWHQCRYGYPNLQTTQQVVQNYSTAGIPLETMWNDIDYMNAYEDFSWDPNNFPQNQVASFVSQLHSNNQHYVVIVDPGIHVRSGYPAYDSGISQKVFLMRSDGVTPFQGQVWPGTTTFPDFWNPAAQSWWNSNFQPFLTGVPVDGIWIDMNEISNFQNGDVNEPKKEGKLGDVNNPTYKINNFNSHSSLNTKTTAMDALHYGGIQEYNVHNLFGFTESVATNKMLVNFYNKRPFVLSRSTFSVAGKWTAHWLVDNYSTWQSLQQSIPGILDMNLFGIPFVGADICGFNGNTNEELCARWSAVGSFYPFSRNHNCKGQQSQEPYLWPSVTNVMKKCLGARYSLLPYYYTLYYKASTQGGQVAQSLLFAFPTDKNTYPIDRQFMIGDAILISPVLDQGATSVNAYFPNANWYSFWDNTPLGKTGTVTVQAALEDIPVHIRGGSIVPVQTPAMTIAATRNNPFKLLVALDASSAASGSVYLDDGISVTVSQYTYVTYQATSGRLNSTVVQGSYNSPNLSHITVLGLTKASSVSVNGASWSTFSFNSTGSYLDITGLSLAMNKAFSVTWA